MVSEADDFFNAMSSYPDSTSYTSSPNLNTADDTLQPKLGPSVCGMTSTWGEDGSHRTNEEGQSLLLPDGLINALT